MRRLRARLLGRLAADLHRLASTLGRWAGDGQPPQASPAFAEPEAPEAVWQRLARPGPPEHWLALLRERAPHLLRGGWRTYRTPVPADYSRGPRPVTPGEPSAAPVGPHLEDAAHEEPSVETSASKLDRPSAAPARAGTATRLPAWPRALRRLAHRFAPPQLPSRPRAVAAVDRDEPEHGDAEADNRPAEQTEPTPRGMAARSELARLAPVRGRSPDGPAGTEPQTRDSSVQAWSPQDGEEAAAAQEAGVPDDQAAAQPRRPVLVWPHEPTAAVHRPTFPDEQPPPAPRPLVWPSLVSAEDWPALPAIDSAPQTSVPADGARLERLEREQEGR